MRHATAFAAGALCVPRLPVPVRGAVSPTRVRARAEPVSAATPLPVRGAGAKARTAHVTKPLTEVKERVADVKLRVEDVKSQMEALLRAMQSVRTGERVSDFGGVLRAFVEGCRGVTGVTGAKGWAGVERVAEAWEDMEVWEQGQAVSTGGILFGFCFRWLGKFEGEASGSEVAVFVEACGRVMACGGVRNVGLCEVPRDFLRAHACWEGLVQPGSFGIGKVADFRGLRQESEVFRVVRQVVQIRAEDAWKALGFGETLAAEALGSAHWEGIGHQFALDAWIDLCEARNHSACSAVEALDFAEEYALRHQPNAALSYIAIEEGRAYGVIARRMNSEPVRLQELGLCVLESEHIDCTKLGDGVDVEQLPIIAGSPLASVKRRRTEDYGAWETRGSGILSVESAAPYIPTACADRWRFRLLAPRQRLSAAKYAQLQLEMLCVGQHAQYADFVSYAPLGGATVTRVPRNDVWLGAALRHLQSMPLVVPPAANFGHERAEYHKLLAMTRSDVLGASVVASATAEECEEMLEGFRKRGQEGTWREGMRLFLDDDAEDKFGGHGWET